MAGSRQFNRNMANPPESRNVDPRVVHGGGEGANTSTTVAQAPVPPVNLYTAASAHFNRNMAIPPVSRNVDPRVVHGGGEGASISTRATQAPVAPPVNLHTATQAKLIECLRDDRYRGQAMALLYKRSSNELAQNLWSSFNTVPILLQEVLSLYKLLSPPMLTKSDSARVCNAIALFQCIALNPDTRMGLINAEIPVYLYPYIKNSEMQRPFERLKLVSLSVISALLKTEDSNTPNIIQYLLGTDIFPLLIGCMEHGNENTKLVATFIVSRILRQKDGTDYMGFRDRFCTMMSLLGTMLMDLSQEPPLQLLRDILSCYLSMSEVSKLVGAQADFRHHLPWKIVHRSFVRVANGDPSTKLIFGTLLQELEYAHSPWFEEVVAIHGRPISKK